jgi:hypothetical protein
VNAEVRGEGMNHSGRKEKRILASLRYRMEKKG